MTTNEAADFTAVLQKYDQFINDKLKPDLKATLDSRDALYDLTSDLKLKAQIETIQTNDLKEMKTMVDLGSNFYAQAKIPDTRYIYINVGFGFHVQMTLKEALVFIEKKNKQLQNRADKYSEEAAKIRANIKLVMRAIQEILQLPDADEN
ncbi:hypothetical protein INT43_006394 [Umbelopsis isabellina]|uniref:Protein UXT n=1 Tax=Mortierella isabellina TaxID=91625 RepID=A0A8H7Q103_MORIS|nr:hypothetical protein INT43_006394 [Umbelopsis isabellina]